VTPILTIFTASVRLDLARLWLACVERAFPRDEVVVEIFDDSKDGVLTPHLLPRATLIHPGPGRRDFQEAYNDALGRAATPWLAFFDTDAYAVSREVWPRMRARLRADVAAVLCAPRTSTEGHDTVALVLNVSAYRAALADVPGGFLPRVEREDPAGRPGQWRGRDTGDLLTRAVEERGGTIDVLPLEEEGAFVRFDALTNTHLLAEWSGIGPLLALAREQTYFREGCLGNLALRGVYRRFFPGGPPFSFRVLSGAVWRAMASGGFRSLRDAVSRARRMRVGARRLETFLRT
jgi:hypothetical protein